MGKVFKQRTTHYYVLDVDGKTSKRCSKSTPGAKPKVVKSREYYGEYDDAFGKRVRVKLCADARESRDMLSDLAAQSRKEKHGLGDRYKKHRNTPLADHLSDYRSHLEASGDCEEHVEKTLRQLEAVVKGCRFTTLWDISATTVQVFVGKLRVNKDGDLPEQEHFTTSQAAAALGISIRSLLRYHRQGRLPSSGKAPGSGPRKLFHRDALLPLFRESHQGIGATTANHYIRGAKSFTAWAFKNHRMDHDPLSSLGTLHEDDDLRHHRRTLTPDEFETLLEAALQGEPFRTLSGRDRFVIYALVGSTGLRASEVASLTPESFALDGPEPTVTVTAGESKHRKEDVQPMRSEIATMIREYLADRNQVEAIWPGSWVKAASEMIQIDLAAAGIPYEDAEGRVFDFHATRGQFITSLTRAGIHPKITQVLARHSDIRLTMKNYTHLGRSEVANALNQLPPLQNRLSQPSAEGTSLTELRTEPGAMENAGKKPEAKVAAG